MFKNLEERVPEFSEGELIEITELRQGIEWVRESVQLLCNNFISEIQTTHRALTEEKPFSIRA